jgi:hypothetical protein
MGRRADLVGKRGRRSAGEGEEQGEDGWTKSLHEEIPFREAAWPRPPWPLDAVSPEEWCTQTGEEICPGANSFAHKENSHAG